jgi:hypothetical protein
MNIGIIGAGKMGGNLARLWAEKGHRVKITSKSIDEAEQAVKAIGSNASSGSVQNIVDTSDIVLLAVPYSEIRDVAQKAKSWQNTLIIEIINPVTPDLQELEIGFTTSAAEEIAKLFKGSKVVAAFNTIPSPVIETGNTDFNGEKASVFYCGDDEMANKKAQRLIEDAGFDAVYSGKLSNARYIEPAAELIIQLAINGLGANISLKLLKR